MDEVIAGKLAAITPPNGLFERCLAEGRRAARQKLLSHAVLPLAALLAVGLLIYGLVTWGGGELEGNSLRAATADWAEFFDSDFRLEKVTADLGEIRAWYAAGNSGEPVSIPQSLEEAEPLGCREIEWGGESGSLICFKMKDGQIAHLIVISNGAFLDPPGAAPEVARVGDWTRSAWRQGGMTYLLFSPGDSELG